MTVQVFASLLMRFMREFRKKRGWPRGVVTKAEEPESMDSGSSAFSILFLKTSVSAFEPV
jgi:hypothetical protein